MTNRSARAACRTDAWPRHAGSQRQL